MIVVVPLTTIGRNTPKRGATEMALRDEIAERMISQIRSGETWFPSARGNHECFRTTAPKINAMLIEMGLIRTQPGKKISVVPPMQSPLSSAIERLILDEDCPDVEAAVLAELNKRRSITIASEQADLITHELAGQIPISSHGGLIVSEDPFAGEFHLQLTDFAEYKKQITIPSSVGIVTQSDYYWLQARAGLGPDRIYMRGDTPDRRRKILRLCPLIICDSLHYDPLRELLSQTLDDQRSRCRIITIPYINQESVLQLKRRLLC